MHSLYLNSIGTEMKFSFNTRLDKTEEVNKFEESIIEIIQSEPQKEKKILKKNEQSLRDLWDNIKFNIYENWAEKKFEEIMTQNFLNLVETN